MINNKSQDNNCYVPHNIDFNSKQKITTNFIKGWSFIGENNL